MNPSAKYSMNLYKIIDLNLNVLASVLNISDTFHKKGSSYICIYGLYIISAYGINFTPLKLDIRSRKI